jgi:3-hydroxyisobutyrate dehydrogenase
MVATTELPKNIGWVGLGLMGLPMAKNIIGKTDKSTKVYVYDVAQEAIQRLVDQGQGKVEACSSSKEVADKSVRHVLLSILPTTIVHQSQQIVHTDLVSPQDVILSMVPEGSHVRAVYLNPESGVLASNLNSKILIDCSTIDTGTSLAVRDATVDKHPKARFYDAPVSGGVIGAEQATLTFMLGCSEDNADVKFLTELLSLMGGNIFPCGGPSLGLTAKLCNNYTSAMISLATSESMNIGMRAGMDPRVLANIFHTSTAQSAILDDWCPVPGLCPDAPTSKGYKPGFRIELMKKDIGLAVDTAKRLGARLAIGEAGLKVYEDTAKGKNLPGCKGSVRNVLTFLLVDL